MQINLNGEFLPKDKPKNKKIEFEKIKPYSNPTRTNPPNFLTIEYSTVYGQRRIFVPYIELVIHEYADCKDFNFKLSRYEAQRLNSNGLLYNYRRWESLYVQNPNPEMNLYSRGIVGLIVNPHYNGETEITVTVRNNHDND